MGTLMYLTPGSPLSIACLLMFFVSWHSFFNHVLQTKLMEDNTSIVLWKYFIWSHYSGNFRCFSVSTALPFKANENENSPFRGWVLISFFFHSHVKTFKRHPDVVASVGLTRAKAVTGAEPLISHGHSQSHGGYLWCGCQGG